MILSICEMALKSEGYIGFGRERVAYFGRWGTVGEKEDDWAYNQVMCDDDSTNVYFSPQQMLSYSKRLEVADHDPVKSDVFALGLMLVEIVFQESLEEIYDYENYEIKLKPLLEKLSQIRGQFGDEVYEIFIRMLEIEEDDRADYEELF